MTETPRQYKKRIDEKWQRNAKNKEKLIQKIESYDLLDDGWKLKVKQEILDNFQKNQKSEQEGEQYVTIVSELGKIDQKYEELTQLKQKLESKKEEKNQVGEEIRGSKLDAADETTLKMQMLEVRKLKDRLKNLNLEVEELEKEIENREQEIKEIEEAYGEKNLFGTSDKADETLDSSLHSEGQDKIQGRGDMKWNNSTLKEYHEQTIQELWNKNRVRGEIFKILDAGTGIDDELKDKIKKEISDRFFGYYEEKQGTLKMKSARYLKNKLRDRDRILKEIKDMPEGKEKAEKLVELKKMERLYGLESGNNNVEGLEKLEKISGREASKGEPEELHNMDDLIVVKSYGEIGGEPVFQVKNKNGYYRIVRGNTFCGGEYVKIGRIWELGGKPGFEAKDEDGDCSIVRGKDVSRNYLKRVGKIINIGGKPCFVGKDKNGYYNVIRGDKRCGWLLKIVGEIKSCDGKPLFIAKEGEDYQAYRGDKKCSLSVGKIEIIGEIGGKPVFKLKNGRYYKVVRGDKDCCEWVGNISDFQNIGGKPFFVVKTRGGGIYGAVRGYEESVAFDKIGDIREEGDKPVFTAEKSGKFYIVEGTEIVDLAKLYREKWEKIVGNISRENKERIMHTVEEMSVNIQIDKDGSKLIKFKLGNKTYRFLNPNLKNHTDKKYDYGAFSYVYLGGMLGDNVDRWENKKLKKYVKEKQLEGFHIPNIEEMRALLQELGEKADISDVCEQIAMLTCITGMDKWYWLSMGGGRSSGSLYSRSMLDCSYDNYSGFDRGFKGNRASLCMMACEENEEEGAGWKDQ